MVRAVSLRFSRRHSPMKLDSTLKSESATATPFGSLKEPSRKTPARIQTTFLSLSFRRQRKSVRKLKKQSKKLSSPKFRNRGAFSLKVSDTRAIRIIPVRPHKHERFRQISVDARSDTVRHGVPFRGRCIPQSVRLERDAIHVATSRVVDQRRRVCDSHWARTLSTSELASQNSASRLCVCRAWGICSCRRGEHPCAKGRNRKPALARLGARDLADHNRGASVCGRVGCSGWTCSSATE